MGNLSPSSSLPPSFSLSLSLSLSSPSPSSSLSDSAEGSSAAFECDSARWERGGGVLKTVGRWVADNATDGSEGRMYAVDDDRRGRPARL